MFEVNNDQKDFIALSNLAASYGSVWAGFFESPAAVP